MNEEVLNLFKEAVAQQHSFERMKQALSITRVSLSRENFQDVEDAYLQKLNDLDYTYQNQPESERLDNHREYTNFKTKYFDGDDDMQVHEEKTYKCPLLKTVMTNPVKNTACGHHYEKSAIEEYVKKLSKNCPVSACGHKVSKSSLRDDPGLLKEIREMERKEKMGARKKKRTGTVVDV